MSASAPLNAPLPPGRKPSRRRWSRVLDRLSIYLPVALMALLALASYWLLRATPEALEPEPEQAATHAPDYFMRRFSVKVFDAAGKLKSEVFGAEVRHHPDTDKTEIDNARVRSFDVQGRLTTAVAQHVTGNADQTEFLLDGDVRVIREAGTAPDGTVSQRLEFRGEQLQIALDPQSLRSERPVTLLRQNDQISGDTLDYNEADQVAVFKGRVKARFAPR
ncbi:LPS export ABC transporter periplasmic protein LptC [Hydrogenophaga sp.]|uniref:LPS export ABC transporter periplasmic protein LptC n=1 Tax=Hydrogenophaga sp. TaxID=1904254 RepID=UPI0035658D94